MPCNCGDNNYTNTQCIAYDGTIPGINISNKNITFVKKNINTFNDNNNTNLYSDIESNNNIFLKMDIEGYEIPWINTLSYKQLNKFSQISESFFDSARTLLSVVKFKIIFTFFSNATGVICLTAASIICLASRVTRSIFMVPDSERAT